MRKRAISVSASKLRKHYQTFENYANQEKFKNNESMVVQTEPIESKLERKLSFATSAKKLNSLKPLKPKHKQAVQRTSITKLHTGAVDDSLYMESNDFFTRPQKNSDFEALDKEDFTKFVSGLKKCKIIESELEMNFEASRLEKIASQISIGLYYQIEEELKKVSQLNMISVNTEVVLNSFSKFTCFLREVIRILRFKNMDNEAITLEFLWRGTIKLVDTALVAQEIHTQGILDNLRENTKNIVKKYDDKIEKLEKNRQKVEKNLEEKMQGLRERVVLYKIEKKLLQGKIDQKDRILSELNNIDKIEVLKNTSKTLNSLTELLEEMTQEKLNQCQIYSDFNDLSGKIVKKNNY